jgi:hypothetical protein
VVSEDFGWENFDIEYVPIPFGYSEWAADILSNHSSSLKGIEPGTDYIYGAIFCSLGKYKILPSIVKALLERWDSITNTFIFPPGERTITLLDMHKIAGLPLEGEPYDESIPQGYHLSSAMLSYPQTLPTLLKIWRELEDHGRVSFQQWCDYFYHTLSNRPHPGNIESSRLYTAAFLSLWICCFIVVGGGPYIRPGVLVMASWMALGRRFALAQPALCSLYYSLRLISTEPINLDNLRRIGPIHYLIGWMGVYMPATFSGRMRYVGIPICPYPSVQPTMLNTMSRKPKLFSPGEAQQFMCRNHNIVWHPYRPLNPNQTQQATLMWERKIFCLSIRRGLLPWRVATFKTDFCIFEPYHPERVAMQFRLDQVVPYFPLASLVTEYDVGVAYAHWQRLVGPRHDDFSLIPDDTRVGRPTLPWFRWFSAFIKPLTDVLSSLGQRCAYHYALCVNKNPDYHAHPGFSPRNISSLDLIVVQRVAEARRQEHIASIVKNTTFSDGP